jgi:hypothetical protein
MAAAPFKKPILTSDKEYLTGPLINVANHIFFYHIMKTSVKLFGIDFAGNEIPQNLR